MTRQTYVELSGDYYRIEKIIHYIEKHYQEQPDLGELARVVNLSEFHFQRMFKRWVGVSPKRFLQYITKEYAKAMLEENKFKNISFEEFLLYKPLCEDLVKNKNLKKEILETFKQE